MNGVIVRAHGGIYEVDTAGGIHEAVLRGRLKLQTRTGDRVVIGDRVRIAPPSLAGELWTIEEVEERTSELARRAPGRAPRPKVIVANVDRILVVFAAARPAPHLHMLDRFLVLCGSTRLECVIVINKVDLLGEREAHELFGPYEEIGYRVLYTSTVTGAGIEGLKELLCQGTSALTGPSGVGKSSLLNRVQPGLSLRVGAVSERVEQGRHTTVTGELIRLECGGFVADTPGLRELELWNIDPEELDHFFPEFLVHLGSCRYGNSCTHSHEPGCTIRQAVEAGEILPSRYESYLRLLSGEDERS